MTRYDDWLTTTPEDEQDAADRRAARHDPDPYYEISTTYRLPRVHSLGIGPMGPLFDESWDAVPMFAGRENLP